MNNSKSLRIVKKKSSEELTVERRCFKDVSYYPGFPTKFSDYLFRETLAGIKEEVVVRGLTINNLRY